MKVLLLTTTTILVLLVFSFVEATPIEKYLFDSTTFQNELNWDKEALGDSNELAGWKEQSFSQKSSGDLWRVHFVCDISSGNPNNWLRLPFINREEANRLIVELEYTIRECKKYPGEIRSCKETFQMLYVESDLSEPAPAFNELNYKYLKTIAPNNVDTASTNNDTTAYATSSKAPKPPSLSKSGSIFRTQVDLPLRSQKQGIYLVFRDQGACVSLLSIKIYYSLCSTQVHNLVIYPKTPTGSNLTDLVPRMGHCIQNAEPKSPSTPYAYCQTNGNWFITSDTNENNACLCKPGYFFDTSTVQCLACPIGKYKSNLSNHHECFDCPENSWSNNFASKHCNCLEGYHRINPDNYSSPCLPLPTEPKNLTVYYLDQTSIKLKWDPIENYDINSINYKLECYKCIDKYMLNDNFKNSNRSVITTIIRRNTLCNDRVKCEKYVQIEPNKNEITDNKVTLSSLDSNSQYLIEIFAQHVKGLFKTKTVDIMVRTFQDIKDVTVNNVNAYYLNDLNNLFVSWTDQGQQIHKHLFHISTTKSIEFKVVNVTYSAYEIRFWPKNEFEKADVVSVRAPAQNVTISKLTIDDRGDYLVQMRAKSNQGWGPYSKPIETVRLNSLSMLLPSVSSAILSKNNASLLFTYSNDRLRDQAYPFTTGSFGNNPLLLLTNNNNRQEHIPTYIAIAVSGSVLFVIGSLAIIILLTRSGKIDLLNKLTKQNGSASSSSRALGNNSDCDSIDFAKRNAQMAYNQLGACSAGTGSSTGSGGSSPMWPPLNNASFKTYIDPHTYEDPTKVVSLFAKELSPSNIIIESVIGGGEFGDVCKGFLKTATWTETIVAIKTLKGAATEQNRCDFLTEASIMAQFNDPNVIRLEGVVTQSNPLMIVTEFMENGSLDSFLRINQNKLKITQMIKMLRDVASGMRYLSDMNYIHRDLAARNILVNKDLVCKVADFGLSREIENDNTDGAYTTKGGKIPVRWTAPEAIVYRKFTCSSDVWSFGVLVWEVLSFGERPYWSWSNTDVIKAVNNLYRLPPPNNCSDCLYKLMLNCWQVDRLLRPKFNEIVTLLDELLVYPDELRKPTKVRELLPINPQYPTEIQLTTTKQFLNKLNLEQYEENFKQTNLLNLSNLFQLESKDLSYMLGIHSQYDQKKLLEELKYIKEAYHSSLSNLSDFKLNIGYSSTNPYQPQPQFQTLKHYQQYQHNALMNSMLRSTSITNNNNAANLNTSFNPPQPTNGMPANINNNNNGFLV